MGVLRSLMQRIWRHLLVFLRWLMRPNWALVRNVGRLARRIVQRFEGDQCVIRAAGLAYLTLLGFIPLLAFTLSVATAMLQEADARQIETFISNQINRLAPQLDLVPPEVFQPVESEIDSGEANEDALGENSTDDGEQGNAAESTEAAEATEQALGGDVSNGTRNWLLFAERVHDLIGNIHSGALRATAIVFLVVIVVSLLRAVESSLNVIWRVPINRSWAKSIVYYWTTITLGPLLLAMGLGLTAANRYEAAKAWLLNQAPEMGAFAIRHVSPLALLIFGFTVFYLLMPNTRVRLLAAFSGGLFTGSVIHFNSSFGATFYNQQGDMFTKIYGGLVAIPMLMAGVFIAWIIVLLGAEVAYAVQNSRDFFQRWDRWRSETPNPTTERLGIAAMMEIARGYQKSSKRCDNETLARRLRQSQESVDRALRDLSHAGLLAEVEDGGRSYWIPARPPSEIRLMDISHAVRGSPEGEGEDMGLAWPAALQQAWGKIREVEREEAARYSLQSLIDGSVDSKTGSEVEVLAKSSGDAMVAS